MAKQARKVKGQRAEGFCHASLAEIALYGYVEGVKGLTRQEQIVLCIVLGLLLTGWAVKVYRLSHPPATTRLAQP